MITDRWLLLVFRLASRYGDWGLSATVGVLLTADRRWLGAGLWAAATVVGLVIQKRLKRAWARQRPCERPDGPPQRAPIPDHGSFPSGHTLHAVLGAVVVAWQIPIFGPLFIVVAGVVAVSRVVLGVHYLSDVAAGAAIGLLLGTASQLLAPV